MTPLDRDEMYKAYKWAKRYPMYETEILTDPAKGVYTVTTYFSDGSIDERQVPKGQLVNPEIVGLT